MAKKQKLYPQEERKKDEEKHNREEMTHTQRELEDISGKFIENTAERHWEQTDPYEKKKKAQCRKNRKYYEVVLVITSVLIGFGAVAGLGYQIGSNSTEKIYVGQVRAGHKINTDMNSEVERLKEENRDYKEQINKLEQQLAEASRQDTQTDMEVHNDLSEPVQENSGRDSGGMLQPEETPSEPQKTPITPTPTEQEGNTIPTAPETVYDPSTLSVNDIPNSLLDYLGDPEKLRSKLYDYLQREGYRDVTSCTVGYDYTCDTQSGIVSFVIILDNINHTTVTGEYDPRYGSYSFSK